MIEKKATSFRSTQKSFQPGKSFHPDVSGRSPSLPLPSFRVRYLWCPFYEVTGADVSNLRFSTNHKGNRPNVLQVCHETVMYNDGKFSESSSLKTRRRRCSFSYAWRALRNPPNVVSPRGRFRSRMPSARPVEKMENTYLGLGPLVRLVPTSLLLFVVFSDRPVWWSFQSPCNQRCPLICGEISSRNSGARLMKRGHTSRDSLSTS